VASKSNERCGALGHEADASPRCKAILNKLLSGSHLTHRNAGLSARCARGKLAIAAITAALPSGRYSIQTMYSISTTESTSQHRGSIFALRARLKVCCEAQVLLSRHNMIFGMFYGLLLLWQTDHGADSSNLRSSDLSLAVRGCTMRSEPR
jgi:hypothetical protein